MRNIFDDIFRNYCIEYDRENKIIAIKKPISVNDFVYLKYLLNYYMFKVDDIRVE